MPLGGPVNAGVRRFTWNVMPNVKIQPPTPPSWLNQLPKSTIRRLDPDNLLHDALYTMGETHWAGIAAAFMGINSFYIAAKRQQRRIARARRILKKEPTGDTLQGIFADVHFYVICWTRIAKLARFLSARLRFRRVGLVLRRYYQDLETMIKARDHLEHFEERLPGGPKQTLLKQPNDLFNIIGNDMTFGGERFGIGPESFASLKAFVSELGQAVLFDSLDYLATADAQLLVRRVNEVRRDVALDQTLKQFGLPSLSARRRRLT
jgi:hypothetical protein